MTTEPEAEQVSTPETSGTALSTLVGEIRGWARDVFFAIGTAIMIVVFWYPLDPTKSYIKRVIGMPGDVVEVRRGVVYVNDKPLDENYILPEYMDRRTYPPVYVEPGHYYVLGDHRNQSNDSRMWGLVPEKYIYGKAVFRYWPIDKMGSLD